MKKLRSYMLALLLICGVLCNAVTAYAASASVSASVSGVVHGDSVTFSVSLQGCDAATSIGIIPSYNTGCFELTGGSWLVSGAFLSDFSGGVATIAYDAARSFSGAVFQFTLKVKDSAALGTQSVSCEVSVNNLSDHIYAGVVSTGVEITCAHNYGEWTGAGAASHNRTCTKCADVQTLEHDFTNACDGACDTCGYTREVKHSYDKTWSSDGQGHYHACSVCQAKADNENHTYDHACDADCNICGYRRSVSHKFSRWEQTDRTHSRKCAVCNAEETGSHSYSNGCDNSCNVCDYTRDTKHSYKDSWSMDEAQHWHECTACGDRVDAAAHVPGPAATETTAQICTVCNQVLAAPVGHTHAYGDVWNGDETAHWKACVCGSRTDVGNHSWGAGTVTKEPSYEAEGVMTYTCTVCKSAKTEQIPQLIPPTTQPPVTAEPTQPTVPVTQPEEPQDDGHVCDFPWWTVAVMLVQLAVIVYLLLIIQKQKKKQ